ncbi:MAG: RNA polymerase sigma factor [Clostridiales bacterium]|nr:RNA polymerase sigma factor [Clostridiales bacterium]
MTSSNQWIQWVKPAQAGDQEAFTDLVRYFQTEGYRAAWLWAGDGAEDILQEAFIICWQKLPQLRKPAAFRSWFYRILRRTALDYVNKHRAELPQDNLDPLISPPPGSPSTGDADRLQAALRELPDLQRDACTLYYYAGFSVKEIAGMTGAPEATVKSRLFHARKKLRALLLTDGMANHPPTAQAQKEDHHEHLQKHLQRPEPVQPVSNDGFKA